MQVDSATTVNENHTFVNAGKGEIHCVAIIQKPHGIFMINIIKIFYRSVVLNHPVFTILLLLMVFGFFVSHAKDFKLDASADALLLDTGI